MRKTRVTRRDAGVARETVRHLQGCVKNKQDHVRMNVAPDQTIILGLQIFLDHRSLSSIDQKILMTPPCPLPHHLPFLGHLDISFFCLSVFFCLFVSISMLHLSKVPIYGAHVTDICVIS